MNEEVSLSSLVQKRFKEKGKQQKNDGKPTSIQFWLAVECASGCKSTGAIVKMNHRSLISCGCEMRAWDVKNQLIHILQSGKYRLLV